MKGISFVTDDKNRKIAVQIDLKNHKDLWEDFYDGLIAEQRKNEETISWKELKNVLTKEGKL